MFIYGLYAINTVDSNSVDKMTSDCIDNKMPPYRPRPKSFSICGQNHVIDSMKSLMNSKSLNCLYFEIWFLILYYDIGSKVSNLLWSCVAYISKSIHKSCWRIILGLLFQNLIKLSIVLLNIITFTLIGQRNKFERTFTWIFHLLFFFRLFFPASSNIKLILKDCTLLTS